jgi:uncharacterized protein
MKFLVWGVIIALVVLWVMRPKALRSSGGKARSKPAAGVPEAMLQCAECNTYFPASEALANASGAVFCCDQHRRLHASH